MLAAIPEAGELSSTLQAKVDYKLLNPGTAKRRSKALTDT
jgi:hypothetical protein